MTILNSSAVILANVVHEVVHTVEVRVQFNDGRSELRSRSPSDLVSRNTGAEQSLNKIRNFLLGGHGVRNPWLASRGFYRGAGIEIMTATRGLS